MSPRIRSLKVRHVAVATTVGTLFCGLLAFVGATSASAKSASHPEVLYVGTFDGINTPSASTFTTIQGAVNAAKKGDWILIAPGDYHETGDTGYGAPTTTDVSEGYYGGVVVTTPDLHLRGLDRNSVIVDGTLSQCAHTVQLRSRRSELPQQSRAQRHRRVEGERCEHRQLDSVQFHRGHRERRQRDLVERGFWFGQGGLEGLFGQLPHGHLHLLRQQ